MGLLTWLDNRRLIKKFEDPSYVPEVEWVLTGERAARVGRALVAGEIISDEEMKKMLAEEALKTAIPEFKTEA